MPIDYANLKPRQTISNRTYVLDAEMVSKYVDAVQDRSSLSCSGDGRPLVPSMAVAALALRGVVNDLEIPGGTLHAGQELEFTGVVSIGETLDCTATLVQNSVRGEWRFMSIQLEATDSRGRRVLRGKSTIMLPVHTATGEK